MTDYTTAVAAGIVLLDQKGPADWRSKIDLDTLDLRSSVNCIIGQVYSYLGPFPFLTALDILGIRGDDVLDCGFDVSDEDREVHYGLDTDQDDEQDPFDNLYDAWVDALRPV